MSHPYTTSPSDIFTPFYLKKKSCPKIASSIVHGYDFIEINQDQAQPHYKLTFTFCNYRNQWGVDFDMKFDFNYCKNSTSWVFLWRWVCEFPNKFHPTQATTQFIQHITKYIQVMARKKKKKKHHIHFYQVHARNGLDTLSLHSAATFGPCSQLGGFCVLPAVVWIIEALALRDGSN